MFVGLCWMGNGNCCASGIGLMLGGVELLVCVGTSGCLVFVVLLVTEKCETYKGVCPLPSSALLAFLALLR